MIPLNLNGYTDIPNGTVANIVTYLEMTAKPPLHPRNISGLHLDLMSPPDFNRYQKIFRTVGEDWLWFSRLAMQPAVLESVINTPGFEIFVLQKDGQDIGLLELDTGEKDTVELGYFGLAAEAVGTGAGRWLINAAITRVFDYHKANRFFLHTCTMDSPQALAFYMRSGFTPYKRAIEIAPDPRLTGFIDRDKGKHHPIIEATPAIAPPKASQQP